MYISEQGLKNLKNYKYIGSDNSLISPYLQPYWEWCVTLLPTSVAPNVITVSGFLLIMFNYVSTWYYCSDMQGQAPWWIWALNCFFLFVYQTLDAIDGKQARRTKSGSPLGELFDHGCDSISCMTIVVTDCCAAQTGASWTSYITVFSVMAMFFFSIWEQYYTAVLSTQSLAGPTEGQFFSMLVFILAMVGGSELFLKELISLGPISINIRLMVVLMLSATSMFGVLTCFKLIYTKHSNKEFSAESLAFKGGYVRAMFPFLLIASCFTLWMVVSPADILHQDTFLCCSLMGILISYISTRTVIARICAMRVNSWYYIIVPLPLISLNALLPLVGYKHLYFDEQMLLYVYGAYVSICYSHMVVSVINELANHLNIYCFSLKHLQQQGQQATPQAEAASVHH